MKLTVFGKKKQLSNGVSFVSFVTTMTRNDQSTLTCAVKFKDHIEPKLDECPIIIEVEKSDANLSKKKYTDKDGNEKDSFTLWVNSWKRTGEVYVDHSLDDFI